MLVHTLPLTPHQYIGLIVGHMLFWAFGFGYYKLRDRIFK